MTFVIAITNQKGGVGMSTAVTMVWHPGNNQLTRQSPLVLCEQRIVDLWELTLNKTLPTRSVGSLSTSYKHEWGGGSLTDAFWVLQVT